MAQYNLRQHYRGADGKLYRSGTAVEVPKKAKLELGESAGTKAKTTEKVTPPPAEPPPAS